MDIADIASKALTKIMLADAGHLAKKQPVAKVEDRQPVRFANKNSDSFICGFSSAEVVPADVNAKKYYLAGYQMNQRVTGILDPTTVNAMWLGCEEGEGILLVSADIIGMTGADVDEVRASLSAFCKEKGCRNISISCTHSHASIDTVGYWGQLPKTGRDMSYQRQLFAAIKKVCIEAWENRRPGKLFIGDIHVPDAIRDGREPYFCNDKLTRIRFAPDDGTTETWFLNFGAHPNTMGKANSMVSADYPYFMRQTINKAKRTNVLFSVGAIAAVNIAPLSEDNYEKTKMGGEMLGEAALRIDNEEQMKPDMTVLCQKYLTPIDNAVLMLMPFIHAVTSVRSPYNKGTLGMALVTELTYLRIGSRKILMLPGEAFPEVVYSGHFADAKHSATGISADINTKPFAEILGDENLIVFGVTNDMTGYMVAKNDFILHPSQPYLSSYHDRFDRNHYHETNSLGYLTTDTVAEVLTGIMKKVNE